MRNREKKYDTVKKYILKGIQEGRYKPGVKIPTEDEVMKLLGFSRSPVRHAISELEQEGYIYKIHGSGSFVRRAADEEPTNIYALLYPDSKGIEKDFIHGMRQAVNRSGIRNLHLVLVKPGTTTAEQIEILQTLSTSRRGAIVLVPLLDGSRSANRLLASTLRKLEKNQWVVVQLDRSIPEYESHCIMSDHRGGAYEMTRHLIDHGHTRIAVMYEHPQNSSIRLRLQGVRECLLSHGLPFPQEWQLQYPAREIGGNGSSIVERIRREKITAVFCFECEIAREIHQVFLESGLAIPQDISLCSFDYHCFIGFRDGFLTAVAQPLEELGYFAVDLILKELKERSLQPMRMIMAPSIMERQSVARIQPALR